MSNQSISKKLFIPLSLAAVLLVGLGVFIGVQWQRLGDVGVALDKANVVDPFYFPDECEGNTFTDYDKDNNKYCRNFTVTELHNMERAQLLKNQGSDIFLVYSNYKDDPEIDTYDIKRLDTASDTISDYASVPIEGLSTLKVSPNNVLYSFETITDYAVSPPTTLEVKIKRYNTTTKQLEPYITIDGKDTSFSSDMLAGHAYIDSNENIYLVSGYTSYYFQGGAYPTRNDYVMVDKDKNVNVVKVSDNPKVRVMDIEIAKDNTAYITYLDATNDTTQDYVIGVKKATPGSTLTDHGTSLAFNLRNDLNTNYIDGLASYLGEDNSITITFKLAVANNQNYIRITETESNVMSVATLVDEGYPEEDYGYPYGFKFLQDSSFFMSIAFLNSVDDNNALLKFSREGKYKEITKEYTFSYSHTENKYYINYLYYDGTKYSMRISKLELEPKKVTEPEPTASCVDFETLTSTGNAPKDQLKVAKQFTDKGFSFSQTKTTANQSCPNQPQIAIKGGKRTAFVGFGSSTQRNDNPDPSETTLGNYFLTDDGTTSKSACQLNVAVLDGFRSNRIEFDIIDVDYRQSNKAERFNIAIFGANNKKLKTIKTPKLDTPSKSYHVVLEAEEPIYSFRVIPIGTVSNWGVAYDNFCSVK